MNRLFQKWWTGQKTEESEKLPENPPEEETPVSGMEEQTKREDVVWLRRMLSHNIRMPMAIISGYGEMLKNGSFSSREEELKCISKICKNIDFLDTLLKVLLDDDVSEESLEEKEWFDILECVREAAGYVKTIVMKAHITISVNSSKDKVMFYGSRIILMRAFYNLIENSIRYMNRPGNIFITVEDTENALLIVYRDDGEGMDVREADEIVKLNYQGSNSKQSGHGFGMYLVKDAVEKNGGSIEIHTGKGKGMGVYMTFEKL